MFVGHTAVALTAKSRAPKISLGWFVATAFGLDLLWPILLLAGIERVSIVPGATAFNPLVFDSYPRSHSLLMAFIWWLCAAGIARWRGIAAGAAILTGAVVVSHWFLDCLSQAPDMPLRPGQSPLLGLVLWNSIVATLMVEGALFLAGTVLYVRATRPVDRIGSWGFWSFIVVTTVMWASGPWSAPPPSPQFLVWFGLGAYLLVAWAGWVDRHRRAEASA
jgi:hypothetical protein